MHTPEIDLSRSENNLSFLDMLFCMLFSFIFYFIVLIQREDAPTDKKVDTTAEFLITVQWPDGNRDDVDVYCEDPLGNIIHFQDKTAGFMAIDRDDLGMSNDIIFLPDGGVIKVPFNKEKVTIRATIEGWYIFNVHMYTKRQPGDTPVTVTIEKLNPYGIDFHETVILKRGGDEKTVLRFKMNKEGEIVETNKLEKLYTKGE